MGVGLVVVLGAVLPAPGTYLTSTTNIRHGRPAPSWNLIKNRTRVFMLPKRHVNKTPDGPKRVWITYGRGGGASVERPSTMAPLCCRLKDKLTAFARGLLTTHNDGDFVFQTLQLR